jgi:hypothetical protein
LLGLDHLEATASHPFELAPREEMNTICRLAIAATLLLCAGLASAQTDKLHANARVGDLTTLRDLLAGGADVNAADADLRTALHWAVLQGQTDAATQLLAAGADVNAVDRIGRTALHYAAQGNHTALLAELLARGAQVKVGDALGDTPLHSAARFARPEAIAMLLGAGADANAQNADGQTPLHVLGAAARPDVAEIEELLPELAQELIHAGATPDLADGQGRVAWPHTNVGQTRQPSGYPTYASIATQLQTYATQYPTICQRFDLGTSSTSDHIYGLKITSNVSVEADKPEFHWIANIHGDEVTGVIMCMNMINYLLTNYPSDSRVANLVNNVEIWIIPSMNPYGYANNTRGNASGTDMNRNFPEGSGASPDPNTTTGRAPEVATIMNWVWAHSPTLGVNYHGGELVVNYPYDNDGLGSTYSPTPDEAEFYWLSEQYASHNPPMWASTDFTHGITNGAAWYSIDGGLQDWAYRYQGVYHITMEISVVKSPAYSLMAQFWTENRESMLAYMEGCLTGARGIVTDAATGAPLRATVTVVGRTSKIYTDPDVGDYHRILRPGTYQLKFDATGYSSLTLPVTVTSGNATRLDVAMGGPPALQSPNGGETLTAGTPATISWTGAPTLAYQVQYSSNYGTTGPTSDGFEGGALGSAYTVGGNAPWYVTTGTPHAGTYSARAGAIGHSQTSYMTRTAQGGVVGFYYKVYSESGADFFRFYVDGVEKLKKSGNVAWAYYTTALATGTHTLKWEYTKDASVSGGSDTVWIDDLSLTGDATSWSDVIALTPVGATSTTWTPATPATTYKVRARAAFGGGNYSTWDESNSVFTVIAPPTGACCQGDGTCAVLSATACSAAGGTYQGDSTVCSPNPCPQPTGACCQADGSCTVGTAAECSAAGGTYQGNDTTCSPNPCPQPTGACCQVDGSCTVGTAAECSAASGTYQGGGTTCTPNPCAPPVCPGDGNCDGTINWRDIDYLIAGQNDNESAWQALFTTTPSCAFVNLDASSDGHVNWRDIDPFIALMNTTCATGRK